MSKKKQFNKKNNNKKLQTKQRTIIEQKVQFNDTCTPVQNKSIKERKGKKKNSITKYLIFTLFFFIGLLFYFISATKQQPKTPTANINLNTQGKINKEHFV